MYKIIISLIFVQYCLAQICQKSQILDALSQACLSCSSVCENCFNISQQSCIGCVKNSYLSYDDISTCQIQCRKSEFVDSESKRCIKCKVNGCVQCTSSQICLVCDQNLVLDKNNNQCNAKKGICESDQQFLNPPFESRKCTNSCLQSYYQNYNSQICEYTQECPQIQQLSSYIMDTFVDEIAIIKENQYMVISGVSCSFAIVDINWNIITKQTLLDKNSFEIDVTQDESKNYFFFTGMYGGCMRGQRFSVMNFETLQIEFDEKNLEQQYKIIYTDDVYKLVFMVDNQASALIWYDINNKKINNRKISIRLFYITYIVKKMLQCCS
ncbi:zinc finger protein (macronuclear) [Tetrahymena thermophila SB210]|uniref:Zinc finger protein n=1 Tax=Tetrahymena thermophila (strain SB210) TaxID=312017 RepID=Q24GC3_TETTS|nr:zinc finger protein [Tetrahymena thermophila SB210]EAS06807.2 zinc finger protein [Tetrahymena thermophila SB210]|eukprot:XP_001027049.2 zinc finger protein [Tetrahymena thermophila SB210]